MSVENKFESFINVNNLMANMNIYCDSIFMKSQVNFSVVMLLTFYSKYGLVSSVTAELTG